MRIRSSVASAMLAGGLALSLAAAPAHAASPRTTPGFHGAAAVPWSQVGRGWVLSQWDPRDNPRASSSSYLVLVSPARARYLLWYVRSPRTMLAAWSGDGRRALLVTQSTRTTFQVLDVRTGATLDSFVFPTSDNVFYEGAAFTRPDGLALLVKTQTNDHQLLAQYSLSGVLQRTYPASFPHVGAFTGDWVPSRDGTTIVMGAMHGLAILGADGALLTTLHVSGTSYCLPQRWWSATTVLAACGSESRLYVFPTDGATPRALTQRNVPPDNGDLSAWRLGRTVYVQVASACGYQYLARLHRADPVRVAVPGVRSDNSVFVVGTTADSLAVMASEACQPGLSLIYYDPARDRAPIGLGRPVTSGYVDVALIYPPPLG